MPQNHTQHTPRGFTLIEVMMSMTVLISLVVIVWGSMAVSFESQKYMSNTFDQFQSLRLSMERMTRELATAYIARHANKPQNLPDFREEELIEDPDTGQLVAPPPPVLGGTAQEPDPLRQRTDYMETAFVGRSKEVHFTSLSRVRTRANEKSSDQCEISYFVRTSKRRTSDGRLTRELVRREDSTLDNDMDRGGVVYTLIDDIETVEFEYWKPGKQGDEADGGRWVDSWDSRKSEFRGTLPERVKITVTVPIPGSERAKSRTFITQGRIMMTRLLDF